MKHVGILMLLFSLSGCSTVMVHNNESFAGEPCDFTSYIYGGVVGDAILMAESVKGRQPALALFGFLDMPFSAAADTMILPIAVYRAIDKCR